MWIHWPLKSNNLPMKTKLLFIVFILNLAVITGLSQVPKGVNYQAIATGTTGNPISNQSIAVKIALQTSETGGTVLWEEQHTVTTNISGLFSLVIGTGTKTGGTVTTFSDIVWNNQTVYLKTSVQYPGTTWNVMGASKVWSVPYSILAEKANSVVPGSKLAVVSGNDATTDALFEVKRQDGQTVFAVYPDGVNVYVPRSAAKGTRGGFAIGGFDAAKAGVQDYFRVTPDSIRAYIDPTPSASKGSRGGFAIGGYGEAKGMNNMYFNLSPSASVNTVLGSPQVLWYPQKNAFLAGNVRIAVADSVGNYSTALGYWSRAAGNYSQAFGYKAFADGDYSTSIGRKSVAGSKSPVANNAFAFGDEAKALGNNSIAFGKSAQATGSNAMALGVNSLSSGNTALSYGINSQATNSNALALGNGTISSGINSTAIGFQSQAKGELSLAIGSNYVYSYAVPIINLGVITAPDVFLPTRTTTLATTFTKSFNRPNIAEDKYSIAIGNGNLAQKGGLAFGTNSDALQFGALAMGTAAAANNQNSVAIGYEAKSNGMYSVAIGNNVTANSYGEFALGQYADEVPGTANTWNESEQLFTIGNGVNADNRSNALTIYKNGKTIVRGRYAYSTFNYQTMKFSGFFPNFTLKDYVYGVYTNLNRDNPAIEYYYSGYFASTGTSGVYKGLYADLINTPTINATAGTFTTINGLPADVSEHFYDVMDETEPSDVVVADPDNKISVVKSSFAYQSSVIGVITTQPMLTMGNELIVDVATGDPLKDHKPTAALALAGRVPVKVSDENGAIIPGDYLTTSSTPGTAMKWSLLDVNAAKDFDELKKILSENEKRRNAIIGKALEGFQESGYGKIMVLISLQ
jgi:hypothetical protein